MASLKIIRELKPKTTGHIYIQEQCELLIPDTRIIMLFNTNSMNKRNLPFAAKNLSSAQKQAFL